MDNIVMELNETVMELCQELEAILSLMIQAGVITKEQFEVEYEKIRQANPSIGQILGETK